MSDPVSNPRMDVDFGRRSEDYARFRTGPPPSFFDRLEAFRPLDGIRAVDLGTGPGLVALELARRGATVDGVDVSPSQIDAARRLADAGELATRCRFEVRPAEDTGLPDDAADLVTASQCWGWFDHDRAAAEVHRVLAPGGLFAIVHNCYLPRHSPVARATEQLVLEHNPGWTMAGFDGLYPQRIDAVIASGFRLVEQFCYDHEERFTHEAWRGRIRTCNGVGSGPLTEDQVRVFDAALAARLARSFPAEPLRIPHRIWAVLARTPDAAP